MAQRSPSIDELLATPVDDLIAQARALREQGHGRLQTYSPKVFIPLTKLCRDVCHYCTFARPPRRGERGYMTLEAVLEIARAGAAAGCHEALFTLGDKPELRYRTARLELRALGAGSTIEYLARACRLVLEETGLLPHANPGVVGDGELSLLRRVTASQGLMLESSSERLCARGMPHFGSPDKHPKVRLAALERAGELRVALTTGILIGIGETRRERLEALAAIARLDERYGHVQEVIVQPFRAKPTTPMATAPEPELAELIWTVAAARIILGPRANLQAPPNLAPDSLPELLGAGINDWGGVSPVTVDHVNPEAPWPELERLRALTEGAGYELAARLPIHPQFVAELERWCEPEVAAAVRRRADGRGLAREDRFVAGVSASIDARDPTRRALGGPRLPIAGPVRDALAAAEQGAGVDEDQVTALFSATGREAAAVFALADELRALACGEQVSYVVTRNINYTNVCYFRCGFCAFSKGKLAHNLRGPAYLVPLEEIVRRCEEAWERGATEVCLQGGIHPGFDGEWYLRVCEAIKARLPDLHVHAFSALEVWQGAATLRLSLEEYLRRLRDAGLASLPGTAAEVLDDTVRARLCPDKVSTAQWLEVHETAHGLGLRSTATIMFGHIDTPRSWARHLLLLRALQQRTGGFTEFVPLPFVHPEAPIYLRGQARPGPTLREAILMHAVARIALHPHFRNVQASWPKLGVAGAQLALRAGANDFGGTLMNESISRAAGASHGQEMPPEAIERAIRAIGRRPRQRTTFYGEPSPERISASYGAPPLTEPVNPPVSTHRLRRPPRLIRPGLVAPAVQSVHPRRDVGGS